ncbi:MAG: hypothetical protein KA449_00495 [Pelolinea sp.]|nr:hypothetical protein [Pelolinea sp.]
MNFQAFDTKKFRISLPETFIGGDPVQDKKAIRNAIRDLPHGHQPLFQRFFSQAIFSFMAADTRQLEGQYGLTTCIVNLIKVPHRYVGLTPTELMNTLLNQLESSSDVLEADTVQFPGFDAVRIITTHRKSRGIFGFPIGIRSSRDKSEPSIEKSLTFIFIRGDKYVSAIFTTQPEFFSDLLPIFEESFATLEIF